MACEKRRAGVDERGGGVAFRAFRMGVWSVVFSIGALTGCATERQTTDHGFYMDGRADHWADKVDLLMYAYGEDGYGVKGDLEDPHDPFFGMHHTRLHSYNAVMRSMPVGESLTVVWRVRATGQIIRKKVDLRPLLPASMHRHYVTFLIEDNALFVYLATPIRRPEFSKADQKTQMSANFVTYEIYPTYHQGAD